MAIGEDFEDVLARAVTGDPAAVEHLYRDTVGLVRGYLKASGAGDVDDVTGDVYVSMISSLPRFVGDESRFRSWLLTIAHRRLVDSFRRASRRSEEPVESVEEPSGAGAMDVDLTSAESEALTHLRVDGIIELIDQLTPDQRAVLLLRGLADLRVREIADVIGKPESAVKALLRRGIAQLERMLGEGDDPRAPAG